MTSFGDRRGGFVSYRKTCFWPNLKPGNCRAAAFAASAIVRWRGEVRRDTLCGWRPKIFLGESGDWLGGGRFDYVSSLMDQPASVACHDI